MIMTAPERYNDNEVLATYLETKNITIYCQGPIGVAPFLKFFEDIGTRVETAFIKPHHWRHITEEYTNHTHILVLRKPEEAHAHGSWLHAMSMHEIMRKRNNMFYNTHLRPSLGMVHDAEFDFYMPFEHLPDFLLHKYELPSKPAYNPSVLFNINEEIEAYKYIKENKMKLTVPLWRELMLTGQLKEI